MNFYLCFKILFIVGFLLGFLTIGSYFSVDLFLKKQIHKKLLLKENSTSFYNWLQPPAVIYRKYYLFNVNNPYEVQQGLEKPDLTEQGPYVYREIIEKRDPVFTDDDKITYSPASTLYFEPSLSNGTEDDLITFVNVPAVAMIEQVSKEGMEFLVSGMLQIFNIKLFMTKTVRELIVGYNDPLLNMARFADPKKVKSSKFGLLDEKNGTTSFNLTIEVGSDNSDNIGKVVAWKGSNNISIWSSVNANELKGYDGIMYPPFLKRDKTFFTFNAEMCRSLKWVYLKDSLVDGVNTLDFHLPENVFYNSSLNPENDGYCSGYDCLGNGVFNMSKCQGGISLFGSLPHFLNAEEKITNSVTGLKPDKLKHDYVLSLEQLTGAPVKAKARFQLNLYVKKNEKLE